MTGGNTGDFLARVSERARVPQDDAEALVRDFMGALTGVVDRESWDLVRRLMPEPIEVSWEDGADYESTNVEQFLLEVSRREPVAEDRAAEHARAVASAIREQATAEELEHLASTIQDDDVLALFEETRGGLTAPETPTEGEKAIHSPPEPQHPANGEEA